MRYAVHVGCRMFYTRVIIFSLFSLGLSRKPVDSRGAHFNISALVPLWCCDADDNDDMLLYGLLFLYSNEIYLDGKHWMQNTSSTLQVRTVRLLRCEISTSRSITLSRFCSLVGDDGIVAFVKHASSPFQFSHVNMHTIEQSSILSGKRHFCAHSFYDYFTHFLSALFWQIRCVRRRRQWGWRLRLLAI